MHRAVILWVVGWLAASGAFARTPEDQFFEAARIASEAELAASKADWPTARARLERAIALLEKLRTDHPAWNTPLVEFRLRTYRQQLTELPRREVHSSASPAVAAPDGSLGPDLLAALASNAWLQTELQLVTERYALVEATNTWLLAQVAHLTATNALLSEFGAELTAELRKTRQMVDALREELGEVRAAARSNAEAAQVATQQTELLQTELSRALAELDALRRSPEQLAKWRQRVLDAASDD